MNTTPTTLARHSAITPLALVALSCVGVALSGCRERPSTAAHTLTELSVTELLLDESRRCWNPRTRSRLIREAAERIPGFGRGLAGVLANPAHPFLAEAVLVSASIDDENLAAPLLGLWDDGPRKYRASLVRAIDHSKPWSSKDLLALVTDRDPEVQLAALGLCAMREDPPIPAILSMLGTSPPRLRRAARECLNATFSPQVRTQLLDYALSANSAARADAILVLAGHVDAEAVSFLLTLLEDESPQVRVAALATLATARITLPDRSALGDILVYDNRAMHERALAALCLERVDTLTAAAAYALDVTDTLDPVVSYCTARALIRHGSWGGVERLIRLLEEHESTSDESIGIAALETRQILGRLSGAGAAASIETYRDWATLPENVGKRALPRSSIPRFWLDWN